MTPNDLMDLHSGRTSMQAQKLIQVYIGKWIELSRKVMNVTSDGGVIVEEGPRARLIIMNFDKEWIGRLEILQPGLTISVFCQIWRVDSNALGLDHCEFVR